MAHVLRRSRVWIVRLGVWVGGFWWFTVLGLGSGMIGVDSGLEGLEADGRV